MTSTPTNHNSATYSLPQYGFGQDVDFHSLSKNNHFLFRVYTPKTPSPFADDTEPFFVAPKFNERFNRSPKEATTSIYQHNRCFSHFGTYHDVANHMDWTTKSSSQYISTSFSFIWSIWEALRRYHLGVKKDIEIAVIDASALERRAVTAAQLLRSGLPSERRKEHWKWYRFAQESQLVLVHHSIPAEAVFASIPLLALLEKLPSYFLRRSMLESSKGSPLMSVGWDYTEKKRNYRRFCQEMSNRFLQLAPEARLQDTTAGSVRMALAFLRPWFHQHIMEDFQTATVTLCALSFNIAQWPGQWWAQEHTELWDLMRAIVLSVAEEVRATKRGQGQDSKQVVELRGVIANLEDAVERYKKEIHARVTKKPSHLTPLLIPPPLRSAILPNSPSPLVLEPTSNVSTSRPQVIVTPMTPPTSPIRSKVPAISANRPEHDLQTLNNETPTEIGCPVSDAMSQVSSPTTEEVNSPVDLPQPTTSGTQGVSFEICDPFSPSPPTPCPSLEQALRTPLPEVSSPLVSYAPHTLVYPSDSPVTSTGLLPPVALREDESSVYATELQIKRVPTPRKPPTIAETASCLVTGFFVGAFITLCLLSPQRRTLLLHLT